MQVANWLTDYRVLFLEESPTLQDLFDLWLGEISTQSASTLADFYNQFDATVAVVCLCQSLIDDDPEAVRNHVLARNPFCQTVLVASRSATPAVSKHYDAVVQRPVFRDDLRTTVEKRLLYGAYSSLLHEFYVLNARRSSLRESDSVENVDTGLIPDRFDERIQEIEPRLTQLQTELLDEDVSEIWRSIARHRDYLTEPNQEIDPGKKSKHHPDGCPECDLPWGHDHGNELGIGFIPLGAGVWKCVRCDNIIHGLSGSRQRVV